MFLGKKELCHQQWRTILYRVEIFELFMGLKTWVEIFELFMGAEDLCWINSSLARAAGAWGVGRGEDLIGLFFNPHALFKNLDSVGLFSLVTLCWMKKNSVPGAEPPYTEQPLPLPLVLCKYTLITSSLSSFIRVQANVHLNPRFLTKLPVFIYLWLSRLDRKACLKQSLGWSGSRLEQNLSKVSGEHTTSFVFSLSCQC